MPSFILRDAAGKSLGVVTAEDADAALRGTAAFRADPDNPWRQQLSALVTASGLSNREFARRVLGRDVRSLSRYLGGDIMPPELADQVMRMQVESTPHTITIRVRR